MDRYDFNLGSRESGPLNTIAVPLYLSIALDECHVPIVNEGDAVFAGTCVATSSKREIGFLHSPVAGTVDSVSDKTVRIIPTGNETAPKATPPEHPEAMRGWLGEMGLNTGFIRQRGTLIINAVPREPGQGVLTTLMQEHRTILETGLECLKSMVHPSRIILAAAKGTRVIAFSECSVTFVPARHPWGMPPMVIKAVTGEESLAHLPPDSACIVNLEELYAMGRIINSGQPLTHAICQMKDKTVMLPLGTPAEHILSLMHRSASAGDRVIFGGPLTGKAVLNLKQGSDKTSTSVHIIPKSTYPPTSDAACIGCGECSRRCPSRIRPDLVSRAAEFKLYERCEQYGIFACIECGICGFHCPVRRPLLQYIRHAKREIILLEGGCEIQEAPAS